jgi:hypothetical protein
MKTKVVLFAMLAPILLATLAAAPARVKAKGNDAKSILKAMSDYVGRQKGNAPFRSFRQVTTH